MKRWQRFAIAITNLVDIVSLFMQYKITKLMDGDRCDEGINL